MPNPILDTVTVGQTTYDMRDNSKGLANGIASLDSNGKVPSTQLISDVQGYASQSSFPATGGEDKIYIDKATDTLYRWDTTGSEYTQVGGKNETGISTYGVTIPLNGWSNSAPYTYTWTSQHVTASCDVEVRFADGVYDTLIGYMSWEQVSGGVQFTTNVLPNGNVPVVVKITDSGVSSINTIDAEDVNTDAVSGASNVQEALEAHETLISAFENAGGDLPFTIQTTDWSANAPYTYTWTNSKVTTKCRIEVTFRDGTDNSSVAMLEYQKVSGGVQFTAPIKPTVAIPVTVHIINAQADSFTTISDDMVESDAITGATNVNEALTALNSNITNIFNYTTLNNVACDANGNVPIGLNGLYKCVTVNLTGGWAYGYCTPFRVYTGAWYIHLTNYDGTTPSAGETISARVYYAE